MNSVKCTAMSLCLGTTETYHLDHKWTNTVIHLVALESVNSKALQFLTASGLKGGPQAFFGG